MQATLSPPTQGAATAQSASKLSIVVFLYFAAVMVPFTFHAGPLLLTSVRLCVLIMIIPLFINLMMGKYGRILLVDIVFTLYVIWMGVALMMTTPSVVVQQTGSVGAEFLGSYLVGRAYIRTKEQFVKLCKLMTWSVLIMLPLALLETQTGTPYFLEALRKVPGINSFISSHTDPRMGLHRVQGHFAHPIHFGLFCSLAIVLTLFVQQANTTMFKKLFLTGLVFGTAFLGLSAGVLMALVMQIMLVGWYFVFRNVPYKWVILFGVFVVMYIVVDLISTRDPIRVFITYATFSPHTGYWRLIIFEWGTKNIFGSPENGIPAAPLFGIGMNDWMRPDWMHSGSMDNFWLVTGVRYGVPGFLFMAIGYFWTLWKVGQRKDFDDDADLMNIRRAWVITFVALALTLSTVHIWNTLYGFVFFLFGAGVWLVDTPAKSSTSEETKPQDNPGRAPARYTRFPTKPDTRPGPAPI